MTGTIRWGAMMAVCLATAGCGLLRDPESGCGKPLPYQSAEEAAPLRVPAGSDIPDTRNALHIPEVQAPERPVAATTCLDYPPKYGPPPQRSE